MQYQLDDNTVINFDLNFINDVEVDFDIELPILTISHEETPTISPLEIIDFDSSSIECAFDVTTEQAEEVVKGVLCGTTNPPTFENADYRLLHGQGSMDLAFARLHNNTEYYLRPYALSNLGYKYGDVVVQRTKAIPIPDEYQLVEWLLKPSGVQPYINTLFDASQINKIEYSFKVLETSGDYNILGASTAMTFAGGRNLCDEIYNGSYRFTASSGSTYIAGVTNIWYESIYNHGHITLKNKETQTIIGESAVLINKPSLSLYLFQRNAPQFDTAPLYKNIYIGYVFIVDSTEYVRKFYPVYRKIDRKPGMYDIIGNQFYTNQGTGEFTVGPDKEWEE